MKRPTPNRRPRKSKGYSYAQCRFGQQKSACWARYLRPDEANAVIDAAGMVGRQRLRDQVLLRLMYRHGLRASEAKHTKWADFDLTPGSGPKTFHVRRLKDPSTACIPWIGTRFRPCGS